MTKIDRNDFDRIIYIGGIGSKPHKSENGKSVLRTDFTDKELFFFSDVYYELDDFNKIEKIISSILHVLEKEKNTIVISHSFGGIIGRTVINRLISKQQIKLYVSMASPHKLFYYYPLKIVKRELKSPKEKPCVPYATLGSYLDPMVPFFVSHIDILKGKNIGGTHTTFYNTENNVRKMISYFIKEKNN